MVLRVIVRGAIALIRTVFGWIPDGPTLDLPSVSLVHIPAPAWLYESANTAVRTPLGLLMGLVAFQLTYGLFRRVAELLLGKRGEAL